MTKPLLYVDDLVKEYATGGEALRVLDCVDLELGRGESTCIMGPSGSGKSTLLNIVGTLDVPTSGTVEFDGTEVHKLQPDRVAEFRNRSVGFVFQDHHLLPQCTALENVLIPCMAIRRVSGAERERASSLLERVGLQEKGESFPAQLSGGERQRVAIARAMVNLPKLLLCDEPTGNLDAENGRRVAELLESLRTEHEIAVIVATHDQGLAERFGRRLLLREGKLHE